MIDFKRVFGGVFLLAAVLAAPAGARVGGSTAEADPAATYPTTSPEREPAAAGLRVALAVPSSRGGQTDEAIELFETQADTGLPEEDVVPIQRLIRERQFDKALKAVDALEKRYPGNARTFNLRGAVYLAKDDVANARKAFERAMEMDAGSTTAAMNLAQLDLRENKPDAARQRFQAMLAKDGTNFQAMMGLAGIAAATSQEAEYVGWLEKAANAGPKAAAPRVLLATYYLRKNDVPKALAMAREASAISPDDPRSLEVLGSAQIAAGQADGAVVTYQKLVARNPKDAVAHYKLATAHAAMNNAAATKASVEKALALKPDYLDAQILLAVAELGAGRHAEALKVAQRIQKQHPKSASGYSLQGDILMAQKKYPAALTAYEKALAIQKGGVLAVKVHQALSAAGNAKEADARLLKWLQDQPNDVVARTYLAGTYHKAHQNAQAIEQYQLLVKSDPNNIRALNNLAWLYHQQKDSRALATAEQAYRLRPDIPEIMDTLGWILVEQGNTARGLELLQKAAEKAPASPAIQYHWAATLAKSGDKTRARRELEALLSKNKQFPQREEAEALLKQL